MTKQRKHRPDPSADACTCIVQRPAVGEDHARDCLLYRQRGSGISVISGKGVPIGAGNWWSASGRTNLERK